MNDKLIKLTSLGAGAIFGAIKMAITDIINRDYFKALFVAASVSAAAWIGQTVIKESYNYIKHRMKKPK